MPSFIKPTRSSLHRLGSKIIGGKPEEKVKMPGKSNKFDYSNRPNSGAKLGEIIGTSLQKETEKVKRDAERLAAKARKQSSDSSGGVYEASSTSHIIDLKAPNKDLGDDGVCAMADGMEAALRNGTATASLALEDLNLSNNGITTVSLARLAPVIKLAKCDLKTINLSSNKIQVETDQQAQEWETFLIAFKDCMKLRRLDLSGNERLGPRAMEIFARVHVNERPITPIPPGGNSSVLSLSNIGEDDDTDRDQADSVTDVDLSRSHLSLSDGIVLKRMCGLRSIPYIALHNVGLTKAGALWLSYILEDHFYPSQLISELNATNAESIIKAYQQSTHSRGIDWTENGFLDKEDVQLLDKTETIREHRLHDDGGGEADTLDVDEDDRSEANIGHGHRGSIGKPFSRAKTGNRRASMRSIRTIDGGEHEVSELESMRKKIMRHVIGQDKIRSVDLWQSSVEVFWAARLLRWSAPKVRKHHTGEPLFPTDVSVAPTVRPPTPLAGPAEEAAFGVGIDTEKAKEANQSVRASYASKLQSSSSGPSGEPELVITEVTNTPTTPLRLQKPTHRKGAFSEGTDAADISNKLEALIVLDDSPLRFVKFQQRRIDASAAGGRIFRDYTTPTHIPKDITERLLRAIAGARSWEICAGQQRQRAIERGMDKTAMKTEMEWMKKDPSAQKLMLLDSIQCLHYGQ